MKKKLITIFAAFAAVLSFTACEAGDSEVDLGNPVIYIPQATVTGLDNSYPIPSGPFGQNTSYTCNVKDGKLNIALGVIRAGFIKNAKAFSVNLGTSNSETARKLAEYAEKETPAMALPESVCSIPGKIEVEAGKNSGTCYVSVDLNALANNASIKAESQYKLLVLGLEISNPTEYELAEKNTSVVIVLDLNSSNWDNLGNMPEAAVRTMFPII